MCLLLKIISIIMTFFLVSCNAEVEHQEITIKTVSENYFEEEFCINPYFPYGESETLFYSGTFCYDDLIKEDVKVQIKLVEKQNDGYIYKMHIDTTEDLGGEEDVYFYVTSDEIRIFWVFETCHFENTCYADFVANGRENISDYTTPVCADDIDLSFDKVKMFIETNGDICAFSMVNEGAETGFYQGIVFEKNVGITKYVRGFGAMRDHIEIDIKN